MADCRSTPKQRDLTGFGEVGDAGSPRRRLTMLSSAKSGLLVAAGLTGAAFLCPLRGGGIVGASVQTLGIAAQSPDTATVRLHISKMTCGNVACVPSKTLIRAAEAQHRRVHHSFRGIPTTDGQPDWPTVRAEKDALVAELRQTKYWNVLRAYPSITLFQERATFISGRDVRLASGRTLTAGKVVVTTGSSPLAPPNPWIAEAGDLGKPSAVAVAPRPQSAVPVG